MKIRKLWIVILAMVLTVALTACGSTRPQEAADPVEATPEENTEDAPGNSGASKDTLVIYFSAANSNDADAVTSATPMKDGASAVGWIADTIAEETGADVVKIVPKKDYPLEYNEVIDQARKETNSNARPEFVNLEVDLTEYKNVFIGYPIWWYTYPMIMESFFDTYDLSGVNIIPFNAHEGSRDSETYSLIKKREPKANVLEGLPVSGRDTGTKAARNDVIKWLQGLDL